VKKGIVLIVVIGILIIIFTLALVAMYLMTQEARIAEHKIRRMRAFYSAQAAVVDVLERLRRGLPAPGLATPGPGVSANVAGPTLNGYNTSILLIGRNPAQDETANDAFGDSHTCPQNANTGVCIFATVDDY